MVRSVVHTYLLAQVTDRLSSQDQLKLEHFFCTNLRMRKDDTVYGRDYGGHPRVHAHKSWRLERCPRHTKPLKQREGSGLSTEETRQLCQVARSHALLATQAGNRARSAVCVSTTSCKELYASVVLVVNAYINLHVQQRGVR